MQLSMNPVPCNNNSHYHTVKALHDTCTKNNIPAIILLKAENLEMNIHVHYLNTLS